MHKRVMILLFVLLLLIPAVFAATTVTDSAVITSGEFIGILNWTSLQSYPAPCATGSYLTAVNDTTTCVSAIADYTNVVLSNSTLMNTTILQLTSNLSGGSGVASYANIALTNQSNTLSGNQTITQLSTLGAITNISGILLINPIQSTTTRTISVEGNDLTINGTGSGVLRLSMDRVDFSGVNNWINYGYKTPKGAVLENIVPVPVCNSTNYGQLIFPQSYGVLSYCAGNGWRNITDTTNTASQAGLSYGTSVDSAKPSIFDGGAQTFSLSNSNQSAETFFSVSSGTNKATVNIITVGDNNALFPAMIGPSGGTAAMIMDGPRKALISNTLGQNITFNIGDGQGGLNATDQLLIGIDRVQISPDVLMQLKVNTTSITCNAANAGSIIYSTAKHFGCDGTTWQALY